MTENQPVGVPPTAEQPVCPRHPDRVSYVRCQRCERPACPECQRSAAVGFHCVDCVAEARKNSPTVRTPFGGAVTDGRPLGTYGIIGACAAVFLAQLVWPALTDDLGMVPVLTRDEPWRLLTAGFIHDGVMHIVFNMLWVFWIGQALEPLLGRARYLALYLVSLLGGSTLALILSTPPTALGGPDGGGWLTLNLGASGAGMGLLGALFIVNRHVGNSNRPLVVVLGYTLVWQFFFPNISWEAHLGGLVTGAAIMAVLVALREKTRRRLQWPAIAGVAVLLLAIVAVKYAVTDDALIRVLMGLQS